MTTTTTRELVPVRDERPAIDGTRAAQVATAFVESKRTAGTREAYRRDLQAYFDWLGELGGLDPLAVPEDVVNGYVRALEEAGRKPATVARRLSTLSGFYRFAKRRREIADNPCDYVERPQVHADDSPRLGLDRDELRRFLATARSSSPRDYALACLLSLNGLRISEALGADAGGIAFQRGHCTLAIVGKGARPAVVPLDPVTCEAIDAYLAGRGDGPLLATSTGRRLPRSTADEIVRRLARAAGIRKVVSAHSLRHSFVTLSLDAGVPLRDVQDSARHRDPATTRRYDRDRGALDRHATFTLARYVLDDAPARVVHS